jgi:hypothetical protein
VAEFKAADSDEKLIVINDAVDSIESDWKRDVAFDRSLIEPVCVLLGLTRRF